MANLLENNETIGKAKGLFDKLKFWQKIAGFTVVVATVGALMWLVFSAQSTKFATLYTDLDPSDAGEIVQLLKEQNIKYEIKEDGTKLKVPHDRVNELRLDLAKRGLPENSKVGYELFDKTNLGMSEFVQKLNFRRALEGELAKTISQMDEVRKARVHIVIPDRALFKKDQKEPTASITLHLKSNRSLSRLSVEGIQNLVSSSVEGLKTDDVKIVDQKANILSRTPLDESTVAGKTSLQHDQQRRVEEHLADKVQTLLDGVIGVGNTKVRVNAELDFTHITQEKTEFDPEESAVRSEQNIVDQNESADSLSYPYVNMSKNEQTQIANYEISKSVQQIIHSVGAINRLTVSCLINGTVKITSKDAGKLIEYSPRTDEEMQKFSEIVRNAVGYDPGRNDQISVINVPFEHTLDEGNYEDIFTPAWYTIPENKRILFLIGSILIIFALMIALLQSKQVRERMRIALSLPATVVIDDFDLEEQEHEELPEELDFDDDEMLLLPAELPDQLLLEQEAPMFEEDIKEELELEQESLADMADADFFSEELSEDALMKLEIKGKVEDFIDNNPGEAAKLLRMWMVADIEASAF